MKSYKQVKIKKINCLKLLIIMYAKISNLAYRYKNQIMEVKWLTEMQFN